MERMCLSLTAQVQSWDGPAYRSIVSEAWGTELAQRIDFQGTGFCNGLQANRRQKGKTKFKQILIQQMASYAAGMGTMDGMG